MKKTCLLALGLCLWAANGLAFTDPAAGYRVAEGQSALTLMGEKSFIYSPAPSFAQLGRHPFYGVACLSREEAEQALGQSFSTAYFQQERAKLAALAAGELNLRLLPTPLLELKRYREAEQCAVFLLPLQEEALAAQEPETALTEAGGKPAISLRYYAAQPQGRSYSYTLVSGHDRLYLLTVETAAAPLGEPGQPPTEGKPAPAKEALVAAEQAALAAFRLQKPQQKAPPLSYRDRVLDRKVALPPGYLAAYLNLKDAKGSKGELRLCFPAALATELAQAGGSPLHYSDEQWLALLGRAQTVLASFYLENKGIALKPELFAQRQASQRELEGVLATGLARLQQKLAGGPWQLTATDGRVEVGEQTLEAALAARFSYQQQPAFRSYLRCRIGEHRGALAGFTQAEGAAAVPQLTEGLEWQF